MGAISGRYQGNVNPSGKTNWRGDQVAAPQGGQSIYDYSDVALADLGERLVVGDRIFRYAFCDLAVAAGDYAGAPALTAVVTATVATNALTGGKKLVVYTSGAVATNQLADGYVVVQSGTAAHQGYMYRIKSHASTAATGAVTLTLYDEIDNVCNASDKVTIMECMYKNVNSTGPLVVGVAPTAISASSYAWLQTWGPCAVQAGATACAAMEAIALASAGAMSAMKGSEAQLGWSLHAMTTGQTGLVFLTIAP